MDLDNERVLKLIFPNGVPENLQENPELVIYLNKLGTYKVDQLKKEQSRLQDENKNVVEQTQDLAISNYKTFIHTSECSRSIFSEFQNAESQVDKLIGKLPDFSDKCEKFLSEASEINENRRLNSITLKKNAQLLEILELPQLMERCIREGRYEEALELASYVQKLGQNQGNIAVINSIVVAVESLWHTMLAQLVAQLKTDLQLPKCLQIVGYLRRMQAFGNNELKLKFLQARDAWLTNSLNSIPRDDAQQHLTKTIEVTRINLFNIITQYRAIFPDEDASSSLKANSLSSDAGRLFQSWLHRKIANFLETLETDLLKGVNSLDTVLGQCMYFGLSFSRVGADFRALMAPIFIRVIKQNFSNSIQGVNQNFERDLERYTLINKAASGIHNRRIELDQMNPPETLLDFHPLAALCNGYLNVLNELRLCAPIAIANDVTKNMQLSLEFVARKILSFYRQEQQAFSGNEREYFVKFCSCFAYDLIPYIQRCIHVLFPQATLTAALGINLITLENEGITFIQQKVILEPIKHLLPHKVDVMLLQEKSKQIDASVPIAPASISQEG
ncbi:conserved oligomeric Golgi complex subunit 8 [Episyrphus balteatus]|uniref:conserved oligomeric Golgi complex subunit 8 n=1 Tax=Episyrphus balteatus TaxID=286459 RepID=UPI0024857612|nr:conserved oligomeric Golgi complex subunit 8 [Episyrphus balteatus]